MLRTIFARTPVLARAAATAVAGRGGTAGAPSAAPFSSAPAATIAPATVVTAGRRFMSTRGGSGKDEEGKKSMATVLQEFEASLDANELRPLIAENAEELLQEAADAIPFAPGTRGSRRKKRQRERLRVVRRGDYVRKLQGIAKHEERMNHRSAAAVNERLGKLGLSLPKKKVLATEEVA